MARFVLAKLIALAPKIALEAREFEIVTPREGLGEDPKRRGAIHPKPR